MRRENARERAHKRWWRFPVDVPFTAELGEDVSRTPLSRDEFEFLAAHGPLDRAYGGPQIERRNK